MKDIRQKLLATFQVEHREHLKFMREILGRSDTGLSATDLDEIFRRAHSLKGAARAVGLEHVEQLAHRMETLFSRIRAGAMGFDTQVGGIVKLALDSSEDIVAALNGNPVSAPPTQALEAISNLLGEAPPAAELALSTKPPAAAETVKPATPAPQAAMAAAAPVFQPLETVRLVAKNLDRLVNSAGQLSTENLRQELVGQQLEHLDAHLKETLTEQARMRKAAAGAFRQLDSHQEMAGVARYSDYLEQRNRGLSEEIRNLRRLHERNTWALRSLSAELQADVRQARMAPAEDMFESFPKLVRDLAREEGKAVEFALAGGDRQADRVVLQALKDPLMHVLRNALSHGIEPAEERQAKNKPAIARIRMTVETHGNRLEITVDDDGRGLNLERIAAVAVRQGLISEAESGSLPSEEIARLVFQPGFSTAPAVTSVSGRGMGLSVVAEAVSRLQGKAEILSLKTGGTRIAISAPISISSHRLLLVACQSQTFAVPVHGIERLHRIPLKKIETVEGKPMVRAAGRLIALVGLASLLRIDESGVRAESDTLSVAVLKLGDRRLAVAVDAFISEREAVIKELPPVIGANPRLAGGILLEDGSVCLVLNTAEIVAGFKHVGTSLVIRSDSEGRAEKSSRILVVDDSLTTRTLEKSILEARGYDVAIAVDGVEALNYLRSSPVGLVVTDLEMPRLDGFGLLAEIKRDPQLSKIPVIIVSSLENKEHQERGLSLGADAYIVKKRFEQRDLLETIEQIL